MYLRVLSTLNWTQFNTWPYFLKFSVKFWKPKKPSRTTHLGSLAPALRRAALLHWDVFLPHLCSPCFSPYPECAVCRLHAFFISHLCLIAHSCPTLQPHGLQPTRLLWPWGFSWQKYWSGLPCPPPGDLPNPGIEPRSPALQMDSLPSEPLGKSHCFLCNI